MITPADIQSKEFDKAVRGYKEEDVDVFLDELTNDYEAVLKENEDLKAKIVELGNRIEEYRSQESTILSTLQSAKDLMNDISVSAEKRAEILLKNAQLDAELAQRQAKDNLERLQIEEADLERRVSSIRSRFKNILEAELERFDGLTEELFGVPSPAAEDKPDASSLTRDNSMGLAAWDNVPASSDTIVNRRSE